MSNQSIFPSLIDCCFLVRTAELNKVTHFTVSVLRLEPLLC